MGFERPGSKCDNRDSTSLDGFRGRRNQAVGNTDRVCRRWFVEYPRVCVVYPVMLFFNPFASVRALGETDLNPVSGLGKISQLLFAWIQPGNVVANIIAGGVAEAGAQQ